LVPIDTWESALGFSSAMTRFSANGRPRMAETVAPDYLRALSRVQAVTIRRNDHLLLWSTSQRTDPRTMAAVRKIHWTNEEDKAVR
jgi:hypothetical protein